MKKILTILAVIFLVFALSACDTVGGSYEDNQKTIEIGNKLAENQPTPTDLDYSLERYNLIRRAYWVNGKREKAMTLPSPVALPLGYITLFVGNSVVAQFSVEGKVSSLTNYLTPISEDYENDSFHNKWLADTDGTFGDNPTGIFFFDVNGKYYEWSGIYLYTDQATFVENPVITIK